jgi:hypothetical protein
MLRKTKKIYDSRYTGKKPAEMVQTFSKRTGTPNKNSSWTLCKLAV